MRLIDAAELVKAIENENSGFSISGAEEKFARIIQVNMQPTVEAIPIDWITKWSEKFYTVINGKRYYMGDGYDTIWDLLEDWERESQYGKN